MGVSRIIKTHFAQTLHACDNFPCSQRAVAKRESKSGRVHYLFIFFLFIYVGVGVGVGGCFLERIRPLDIFTFLIVLGKRTRQTSTTKTLLYAFVRSIVILYATYCEFCNHSHKPKTKRKRTKLQDDFRFQYNGRDYTI